MADSDSDGEFERFLQEDEASLSPEPMARKSRANGAYTASSASAVTAAAAALLASSKLTQKHKNKSKNKDKILDKNKRLSKTQLSDSEEAPPSYYDDYSTGRGADLDDSDADPYAFDMSSLALASSTKEDKEDADKKKKKKKGFKTLAKKAVAKSAPISMEDRIAEILKRTGSTQIQDDDKSDEDEIGDKDVSESKETKIAKPLTGHKRENDKQGRQHDDEKDSDGSGSDAEHSSLSDSLGVGSADFEVRLPPKPSLDRTRLSLSSLDSEKFVVNRDALNNELATPSRYEQQQMPFSRSEQDEDSTAEKDEYEEDEFELDHTTVEDDKDTFPSYASVQDQAGDKLRDKPEEPLVSQFDKMKALLLDDSVPVPAQNADEGGKGDQSSQEFDLRESQIHLSTSADVVQKPLDASDTFGYGDDDFEETAGSRQASPAKLVKEIAETGQGDVQVSRGVEYSADYEDDVFEADTAILNGPSVAIQSETRPSTTEDTQYPAISNPSPDRSSKVDALLAAKYGDFYTLDDEDEIQKPALEQISSTTGDLNPIKSAATPEVFTPPGEARDSPPSSPPPPPPPADDDEEDEQELNGFTLDAPRKNGRTPVVTHNAASAVTVRESHSVPPSAADRFRQIENHVASLRFIQPAGTPSIGAANSPFTEPVHPVSAKDLLRDQDVASVARAPLIEPLSISFDAGLLAEDEDTQPEIDEFVRSSQIMRHEKRVAAQRASIARENGLVLRLQQAQRQILQLKTHIQETSSDPTAADIAKPKSTDPVMQEDKLDAEQPIAARDATSHLSQTSYSKLQKEIKSQDNLIAAFQRENERLMQQLKQVRQDVHYDVHEANEELRRQIKKLQDQIGETSTLGGGSDNTSKAKYRVAVEARLEAEAHALALQEELSASKLSYQQKLNEVTLELDRVKKAKVELECRYEGVDLAQVAHETLHARELQNELDLSKKEHARALNALQKKLDWYVENQRLLDDQDEELRRLRRQVNAQPSEPQTGTPSKVQRTNAQAGGPSPARAHRRSPNDIRRIQELEGRLAELEEAMRRRHPDSLANLILASRRADDESKTRALEHDYEEKLAAVSLELEHVHEANEKKLASFRQQQEKLLLQYQRKIKEQEKQLKQLSKVPLSHRPSSKDTTGASTTSDAELTKVRRFYTDKIKELERKWEAKYRALRKQQYSGLGRPESSQQSQEGLTYADSALVIANLQRQIREQEIELRREKVRVEQLEAESQLADTRPLDSPAAENAKPKQNQEKNELEEQIADLKTQLEDSERARARLAQTLASVQTLGLARVLNPDTTSTAAATESIPVTEPVVPQQSEAELAGLRLELIYARETLNKERTTTTEKIVTIEKQMTDHVAKNAQLEAQLAGSQREMQSLQTHALEVERHNRSLEIQARRVPELEEVVLSLRRELELPRTPSMVQYRSLELKVATLEQKHKLREAELKVVLDRALTSTHLEQLSRERAHRAAITAKNAEIASFKHQLEEILDELAQLQQPPSSQPLSVPKNTIERPEQDVAW
ncbi:hypothetical protein KRP22_010443 [Phytophthora ramorum]|nr:Centrosomal protein of 162 kDa [Phytophthora ramorum]